MDAACGPLDARLGWAVHEQVCREYQLWNGFCGLDGGCTKPALNGCPLGEKRCVREASLNCLDAGVDCPWIVILVEVEVS